MDTLVTSKWAAQLKAANLLPLWQVAGDLVRAEPRPTCSPCHWSYATDVRPAMIEAGHMVSPEEAERRVLLLANPSLPRPATTPTLIGGFQMITGGEHADAHRHTQAALRVVIEGDGGFTAVDGERFAMHPGDLILTPGWCWHEHGKSSDGPMIWLDVLDVPLMGQLGVSFYEEAHGLSPSLSRPAGFSEALFGHGFTPCAVNLAPRTHPGHAPAQLRYRFDDAAEALALLARAGPPDAADGHRLRYTNAATGGHVLPAIAAYLTSLPAHFTTRPIRQTDAEIILVLAGSGQTTVGDQVIDWQANDVIVVPNWTWRHHEATGDAILFSASDRALQEALGIWRREIAHR